MQILTFISKLKVVTISLAGGAVLFAGSTPLGPLGWANGRDVAADTVDPAVSEEEQLDSEMVNSGDRSLSITALVNPAAGTARDLHLIDLRTGAAVRLAEDPNRPIAHRQLIGAPASAGSGRGYGYLALVAQPGEAAAPRYDAVFVRFSDMQRFTVARGVRGLRGVEPGERQRFRLLLADGPGGSLTFDSRAGRIAPRTLR